MIDGIEVRYVRYVSPRRRRSYARWGAWAARPLRRALRAAGPFDLIHAHNAVPAGDAVRRSGLGLPLIISVHGSDVYWTAPKAPGGAAAVERCFANARLVLANSAATERLARKLGAQRTEVVHLGSDVPAPGSPSATALIVSVAHLVARKNHADVLRALVGVPVARYLVIGAGPEREPLAALARELGVADRVEFAGQLAPAAALERAATAWCAVLPSTDEAFGVAYIEAMAAGIPAIGCRGEGGPEEIAAAGEGMILVPPHDPQELGRVLAALLADGPRRARLGIAARATVRREFTWKRCGERTLALYREALR
jgi:glycosyltransferase involved in cell wall biosynthesis